MKESGPYAVRVKDFTAITCDTRAEADDWAELLGGTVEEREPQLAFDLGAIS